MKSRCLNCLLLSVLLLPRLLVAGDGHLAGVKFEVTTALSEAVDQFNAKVKRTTRMSHVGRSQPPLTVDEVVASIRAWDRKQTPIEPGLMAVFDRIAESKTLPADSALMFTTSWIPNQDYEFTVWWVDLQLYYPRPDRDDSQFVYIHRIRDRTISSRPNRRGVPVASEHLTLPERERLAAKHFAEFVSGTESTPPADNNGDN